MLRTRFVAALAVVLLGAAGFDGYVLWSHLAHARSVRAYHRAETALANLVIPANFAQITTSTANCHPAPDVRCAVSNLGPGDLVDPLVDLLGSGAHIEPGTDCSDWNPLPHGGLVATLARLPCTIAGSIGGHEAVGILFLHHYPLGTRKTPPGAVRVQTGRFVYYYYYGGTDIVIELVKAPSGA